MFLVLCIHLQQCRELEVLIGTGLSCIVCDHVDE